MNADILMPITLIVGFVYSIKLIVESRGRRHLLLASGGSVELLNVLLADQERQRRLSTLRWGVVGVALAIGFGLLQWLGWTEVTPGLIAVLAGASGAGNLVFLAITRRVTDAGTPRE